MSANMSRPFVCDVCAKIFTRNENLERHKRSKHEGDSHRPHECPRCQSRFSRRDVCKRHAERCRGPRDRRHTPRNEPAEPANSADIDDAMVSTIHVRSFDQPSNPSFASGADGFADPGYRVSDNLPQSAHNAVHIAAYCKNFHPTLPILHHTTIETQNSSLLVNIIVAIGALYTAVTLDGESAAPHLRRSQGLWEAGYGEIQEMIRGGQIDLRGSSLIQAWLLHIVYGTYMGDAVQFQKAKNLLRSLVDSVAYPNPRHWMRAHVDEAIYCNEHELHNAWETYIEEESIKFCMYTLQLLDFHALYPCNLRPLTSALDFDWDLPFSSALWEADSAQAWATVLSEDTRISAMLNPDDVLCLPCPSTKSLPLAMQSLMSDGPSLHLLSALESSPITIVFLLTMVDTLVRDMTRSLYQLPPALADPSTYHILSQNQNRQIAAVLEQVTKLVEDQPEATRHGPECSIWTGVERMCLAIKISLYKPDDLLIGGVVDSSVTAGLATATHMTLGRSTGTRRSLQSLLQHSSGEKAVLQLLEEIVAALDSILGSDRAEATREAPWITVASYRIFLAIWRSLRWAASEMRRRAESNTQSLFDTPTVIFKSVIQVISNRLEMSEAADGVPSPSSVAGEMCFSQAINKFWTDRKTWTIGSSMVPIMEEIISAGL